MQNWQNPVLYHGPLGMAMMLLVLDDLFDSHINELHEASVFWKDVFDLDAKHSDCDHDDAGNNVDLYELRRRNGITPGGAAAM